MRASSPRLPGLILVEPETYRDSRGFLLETYNRVRYAEVGIFDEFAQDNHSRSSRGVLRGLHFQIDPGQAKLVRVSAGRVWDVVVDLRRGSPTFGEWEAFELDDQTHRQLYIPVGFAHGYCVLSDWADFAYKVSRPYDPAKERGIAWDDPRVGIGWPVSEPILSARDRANPTLEEIAGSLGEW